MHRFLVACLVATSLSVATAAEPVFSSTTIDLGTVVSDIDASVRFYTEAIGFKEVAAFDVSADIAAAAGLTADKPLSIRVLALGDSPQATKLKLMEVADTKPRTGDVEFIHSHTGFRYLTLLVTDMEATLARLKQAGVKPLGKSPVPLPAELLPPGGFFLTVVRDPDGNLVELIGK